MTGIDEVAEGTYRLEAKIPGFHAMFSIYFIKNDRGVLIEPGPGALVPTIQAACKQLGITDLEYIIPTHIHLDHGGAAGELCRLFPEARVVVHPEGAGHIIDPSRLIRSTGMAFGDDFADMFGNILPVPESQVMVVEDRESLFVDGRELVIIYTPGHAPHHLAVFDTRTKGLFCGEALGLMYDDVQLPLPAVAPPGLDLEVYLNSMEQLKQLKPGILFYSHGGHGDEPEKLISSVIENTRIFGEAVLQALKVGKDEEAVIESVGEFVWNRFGVRLAGYDLESNVKGYIHYFNRRGIV